MTWSGCDIERRFVPRQGLRENEIPRTCIATHSGSVRFTTAAVADRAPEFVRLKMYNFNLTTDSSMSVAKGRYAHTQSAKNPSDDLRRTSLKAGRAPFPTSTS